jgi:hypothetical protein
MRLAAAGEFSASRPALTVTVATSTEPIVCVADPSFESVPAPATEPANVVSAEPFKESVADGSRTVPPVPSSEGEVWLNEWRSRVPPALTVTGELD